MDTKLENFLSQLTEPQFKELERRVRVAIYLQNQLEHKCKPTNYCSNCDKFFCGECYLVHIRTVHQKTTLHALEKFNQQSFTIAKGRDSEVEKEQIEKYNKKLYAKTTPKNSYRRDSLQKSRKNESLDQFKKLVSALSPEQIQEVLTQLYSEKGN